MNYRGPARITLTLVTDEVTPTTHAHALIGKNCDKGMKMVELSGDSEPKAVFSNLSILHVTKKAAPDVLFERITESMKLDKILHRNRSINEESKLSNEELVKARKQANEQAKYMKLSVVRLCFQAYLPDHNGQFSRILSPVYSEPIYDSKSPTAADLKICRMDKQAGCCSGGDEVFLLCDKVQKDDIKVRFFEERSGWQAFGSFGPADVHRQFAIVFKTPPYQNPNIENPVNVQLQLVRKSGDASEPKNFVFYPREKDREEVGRKRKKGIFGSYGFPPGGGDGGYAGGGGGGGGQLHNGFGSGLPGITTFGNGFIPRYSGGSGGGSTLAEDLYSSEIQESVKEESSKRYDCTFETESPQINGDFLVNVEEDSALPFSDVFMGQMDCIDGGYGMDEVDASVFARSEPVTVEELTKHIASKKDGSTSPKSAAREIVVKKPEQESIMGQTSTSHVQPGQGSNKKQTSTPPVQQESVQEQATSEVQLLVERFATAIQIFAITGDVRQLLYPQRHLAAVQNEDGDVSLHLAVIHNQTAPLHNLLETLATLPQSSEMLNIYNDLRQTPLHLAVIVNQPDLIEVLMHNGADPHKVDRAGNTAMHLAAQFGYDDCLHRILKFPHSKSKVNCLNFDGLSALHLAVHEGSLKCVKLLTSANADVNLQDGRSGRTPLHHATEVENLAIIGHLLLEAGAEVNTPCYSGNTALHLAAGRGLLGIAAVLLAAGADPEAENTELNLDDEDTDVENLDLEYISGHTPSDLALGNEKMLKLLSGEPYETVRTPPHEHHSVTGSRDSQSNFPPGDLYKLDPMYQMKLSKLLNLPKPGGDWKELAKRLEFQSLIHILKLNPDPTKALLEDYRERCSDGSVSMVRECLVNMNRQDAVAVIDEALQSYEDTRASITESSQQLHQTTSSVPPVKAGLDFDKHADKDGCDSGLGTSVQSGAMASQNL